MRISGPILKLAVATSLNQPSDVFGDVKDDNSDTQTHMINIWFDILHLPYNSTKRRYTPHGSYEKRQIGNLFVWIKMLNVYCSLFKIMVHEYAFSRNGAELVSQPSQRQ